MSTVDTNAIWLLQGWFLVNSPEYWKPSLTNAFLTGVPKVRHIEFLIKLLVNLKGVLKFYMYISCRSIGSYLE